MRARVHHQVGLQLGGQLPGEVLHHLPVAAVDGGELGGHVGVEVRGPLVGRPEEVAVRAEVAADQRRYVEDLLGALGAQQLHERCLLPALLVRVVRAVADEQLTEPLVEGGPLGLVLGRVDGAAVQLVRRVQRGAQVHVVAHAEQRDEARAGHVEARVEPAAALAALAARPELGGGRLLARQVPAVDGLGDGGGDGAQRARVALQHAVLLRQPDHLVPGAGARRHEGLAPVQVQHLALVGPGGQQPGGRPAPRVQQQRRAAPREAAVHRQ